MHRWRSPLLTMATFWKLARSCWHNLPPSSCRTKVCASFTWGCTKVESAPTWVCFACTVLRGDGPYEQHACYYEYSQPLPSSATFAPGSRHLRPFCRRQGTHCYLIP